MARKYTEKQRDAMKRVLKSSLASSTKRKKKNPVSKALFKAGYNTAGALRRALSGGRYGAKQSAKVMKRNMILRSEKAKRAIKAIRAKKSKKK